jgi:hypothetical protein
MNNLLILIILIYNKMPINVAVCIKTFEIIRIHFCSTSLYHQINIQIVRMYQQVFNLNVFVEVCEYLRKNKELDLSIKIHHWLATIHIFQRLVI